PGAAKGQIVFTADDAVAAAADGRRVILVRPFTEADDVAGFHAAQGILTSEGGKASHAALVARGMGKPCVAGAGALDIDLKAKELRANGTVLKEGDLIAIDGTAGVVTADDVALVDPNEDPALRPMLDRLWTVLEWADDVRRLRVRANADTPADARRGRGFGAEGIGLCRTEHMFMASDRLPKMRAMIMADDEETRREWLAKLLPLQQEDFEGLFEAMAGLPVTIRLLDPPLHEFLPHGGEESKLLARTLGVSRTDLSHVVESLRETNPMLGHRGCRLGITFPEITEMQGRAIIEAAIEVKKKGKSVLPEIMIPLVGVIEELSILKKRAIAVADECMAKAGTKVE